jgi:hypothetical protein
VSGIQVTTGAGQQQPAPAAPAPNGAPVVPTNDSLLAGLRRKAKSQQQKHTVDLAVGGEFGDRLRIRYKVLDPGPLEEFLEKRAGDGDTMPRRSVLNMDLMAQACVCVVGYNDEGESAILQDQTGSVRLEHRLALLLELPLPEWHGEGPPPDMDAHDVIMRLFGMNLMAMLAHGDELATWMQDPVNYVQPGKS